MSIFSYFYYHDHIIFALSDWNPNLSIEIRVPYNNIDKIH